MMTPSEDVPTDKRIRKDVQMSEAGDPLGKRALFWSPVERSEERPAKHREREVQGKHALFSAADESVASKPKRKAPAAPTTASKLRATTKPGKTARDLAKQISQDQSALGGSEVGDIGAAREARGKRNKTVEAAAGSLGPVTLDCSTCGVRSEVDMVEYLVLHLPVWMWKPGKGFTRFMTCPACRRRTWVSASWAPWSR